MLMLYKDCFFLRTLDPGGPLRSMTPLHFSLLDAIWTASGSEHPHQSVMSSDRLLAGRPRGRSPSTISSITIFTRRWSFILQMPVQLQLPLLYHVDYRAISVHSISDNAVAHFVFPAHCECHHITSHFECQEFSGVCDFYCPRLGSTEQTTKDTPPLTSSSIFVLIVNSLLLQNVFSIPNLWYASWSYLYGKLGCAYRFRSKVASFTGDSPEPLVPHWIDQCKCEYLLCSDSVFPRSSLFLTQASF